jgi:flotillin
MEGMLSTTVVFLLVIFGTLAAFAMRYKRCPSDKILVIYGKTSGGRSSRCIHGGAAFVWPMIQAYQFLDLTPIPIDIKLEGALSQQNIRINTPSTFTVGIATEKGLMENAAERLLGLSLSDVQNLAQDIIFGQMRVVIATMPIEEINADRDKLIENISNGVEVELRKVGIRLINVNIQDVTDESGYIDALGKDAAARAINDAKVLVAQKERDGEIGKAQAQREQRVEVSSAMATATEGENRAKITVANSDADRRKQEAEAERVASAAEKVQAAEALGEAYASEETAERIRAKKEQATQYANIVVPAEIEKARIETLAEAEAEKTRRTKQGQADGLKSMMDAEALGLMAILQKKAQGLGDIVQACTGDPQMAMMMMITEQLPKLVEEQVKAISNLKIDSVVVWDGGSKDGGKTQTADFLSGLVGSLPPLHDITKNVGLELPEYLGKMTGHSGATPPDDGGPGGGRGGSGSGGGSGGSGSSGGGGSGEGGTGSSGGGKSSGPSAQSKDEVRSSTSTSSASPEAEDDRVKAWMEDNLKRISAFDLNDDGDLDENEIETAIWMTRGWARKTRDPKTKWFYYKNKQSIGPVSWAQVSVALSDNPKAYINLVGEDFWLPYEGIEIAVNDLEDGREHRAA